MYVKKEKKTLKINSNPLLKIIINSYSFGAWTAERILQKRPMYNTYNIWGHYSPPMSFAHIIMNRLVGFGFPSHLLTQRPKSVAHRVVINTNMDHGAGCVKIIKSVLIWQGFEIHWISSTFTSSQNIIYIPDQSVHMILHR